MVPNKRLQVFISSTYIDLKEERQAAVLAILGSGHIPAGMELFAAGDQSQMDVIKDWIKQSDLFLLILGGCYGSIEPKSGKSYIQLEYEYAIECNKPVFSIVLDDEQIEERIKTFGTTVVELENPVQFREFKKIVLTRMVRFWKDSKDIKIAIFETMNEFSRRGNLIGWVPGNQQIDTSKLTEQLLISNQEINNLKEEISKKIKEVIKLSEEKTKLEINTKTINYKNLNPKSRGFAQRATICGQEIILQTSEYSDGQPGEIFINMAKEGTTVRALLECFAMSVSIGLQYGVPLDEFVEKFVFLRFEPSGFVEHPNIKTCTSIVDFVFRVLGYEYLNRTDLVHILDKPTESNSGIDDWNEIPSNILEYTKEPELTSVRITPSSRQEKK